MAVFKYEGRTAAGEARRGTLEAKDQATARAQLQRMRIQASSLSEAPGAKAAKSDAPAKEEAPKAEEKKTQFKRCGSCGWSGNVTLFKAKCPKCAASM